MHQLMWPTVGYLCVFVAYIVGLQVYDVKPQALEFAATVGS